MGVPHHVIQKNIVVGHRNLLRVLLSLVDSVDNELLERIICRLDELDEEALERVAENHGRTLHMTPTTVRRHLEKLKNDDYLDVIWPDMPDLSDPPKRTVSVDLDS